MRPLVGLVVVSHSARLAEGVVELAGQMAPDVRLLPAGGLPGGGVGTDHDAVRDAVNRADAGAGVILLFDLGSARMTAELVVESLDDPSLGRVVDAPLVEGAVAAAVAAQGGASLAGVAAAAVSGPADGLPPEPDTPSGGPAQRMELTLTNDVGLHARPAALLARALADLDTQVMVALGENEADARSVLAILSLAARHGDQLRVTATGPDADTALTRIAALAATHFDE